MMSSQVKVTTMMIWPGEMLMMIMMKRKVMRWPLPGQELLKMMMKRKVNIKYDEFTSESYKQDDVARRDADVDN